MPEKKEPTFTKEDNIKIIEINGKMAVIEFLDEPPSIAQIVCYVHEIEESLVEEFKKKNTH